MRRGDDDEGDREENPRCCCGLSFEEDSLFVEELREAGSEAYKVWKRDLERGEGGKCGGRVVRKLSGEGKKVSR